MNKRNTPYTYEEVKEYIESFGYKLLSEEYKNANTHILVKCSNPNHKPYKVSFSSFKNNNHRCPYCSGRLVTKENSIGYLYPEIANSIIKDERNNLTYDDTYNISRGSSKKYFFVCPKCNKSSTKKKSISDIFRCNLSCEFCSDGVSIPEKFLANILNYLNIDFISQYNTIWSENKRYDFYIPSLNIIIETHGLQHYENAMGKWMDIENQYKNDKNKKMLAKENNIEKYIIIDCRYSTLEWLKTNVIKELGNIFNLNNINWSEIWEESQNSLVFKVCELWNKGLSMKEISKELKLSNTTIRRYLQNGNALNICDYSIEESNKRYHATKRGKNNNASRRVICLTTKEIFFTMKEATEKYNIKSTGAIPACCKGFIVRKGKEQKIKSVGKTKDGTPLVWMYLEEFLDKCKYTIL